MAAGAPNCTTTMPPIGIIIEGERHTIECNVYFGASDGIWPALIWTGPGDFNQLSANQTGTVRSGVGFETQKIMDGTYFFMRTYFTQNGFGGVDTADNVPTFENTYRSLFVMVQCEYSLYSCQTNGEF